MEFPQKIIKKGWIFLGLLLSIIALSYLPVSAVGIGQCHTNTNLTNPLVGWAYPSGEVLWRNIEPQRGVYNFQPLDQFITEVKKNNKKVWIQVMTSDPRSGVVTIPDWAMQPDPKDGKTMRYLSSGLPVTWDLKYREYLGELLTAMALKYETAEYINTIEAVIMMAGGNYGEMVLNGENCVGNDQGILPDVQDPNNRYLKEMALTFMGNESRSVDLAKGSATGWVFDDYYIKTVNNNIDLYANAFKYYPLILQIGAGLSCQSRVYRDVEAYAISKYGTRVWFKSNWWGSWFIDASQDINATEYKGRTLVAYEVGHPMYFCSKEYQNNSANSDDEIKCYWDTEAQAKDHNRSFLYRAMNDGISAICFQENFFNLPKKYDIDLNTLQIGLLNNIKQHYFPGALICPKGELGNINCDTLGRIDFNDLSVLVSSRFWNIKVIPSVPVVWHTPDISPAGGDGVVNVADLAKLLYNWTR